MRLYIIRHAEPDYAIDGLTAKGHEEASALAEWLAEVNPDELYTSPLGRARATAQYTADRLGKPLTTEEWCSELTLRLTDPSPLTPWDLHGHLIRRDAYLWSPRDWTTIPELHTAPVADEVTRIREASDAFLARQGYVRAGGVYRVENPHEKRLAIFCHGGFGLTWLAHLLAIPVPLMYAGFFMHPSSITTILFDIREPGIATPRCIGLGALPHLARAGQDPSPSGIKANYW